MHNVESGATLQIQDTSSLMGEIAEIATRERMLLNQARVILSTIAALHVSLDSEYLSSYSKLIVSLLTQVCKQVRLCSLRGHLIQLRRKPNRLRIDSISPHHLHDH